MNNNRENCSFFMQQQAYGYMYCITLIQWERVEMVEKKCDRHRRRERSIVVAKKIQRKTKNVWRTMKKNA